MRNERELLELLRNECKERLVDNKGEWVNDDKLGICDVVYTLWFTDKIENYERIFISDEILQKNWHLAKYPDGGYKFDTKSERLEFLDKLIEKYA